MVSLSRSVSLGLIILLSLHIMSSPVLASSHNDSFAQFDKFDEELEEWTNITLTPSTYTIVSDDSYLDGLTGDFLNWAAIESAASGMRNISTDPSEYQTRIVVSLTDEDDSVEWRFSDEDQLPNNQSVILETYLTLFDMITGNYGTGGVWISSVQVDILESYPPQYAVNIVLQRGSDLLAVVEEPEVSLNAGFVDRNAYPDEIVWTGMDPVALSSTSQIPSGGQSVNVQFETFYVAESANGANFSNVLIFLQVGNYNLSLFPETGRLDLSTPRGDISTSNSLPVQFSPFLLSIPLMIVVVRRRRDDR